MKSENANSGIITTGLVGLNWGGASLQFGQNWEAPFDFGTNSNGDLRVSSDQLSAVPLSGKTWHKPLV